MKKILTLITLFFLLLIPSISLAQQLAPKEFPKPPQRHRVSPTQEQLEQADYFYQVTPDWDIRWGNVSRIPATMMGLPQSIEGSTILEKAYNYILKYAGILGVSDVHNTMTISTVRITPRAKVVVFQQYYENIPVEGARYAINFTLNDQVYYASGRYYDDVDIETIRPSISSEQARSIVINDLNNPILKSEPEIECVILPYGNRYVLAWKIRVNCYPQFGDYRYYISALDGTIITGNDMVRYEDYPMTIVEPKVYSTATGEVYLTDPDDGFINEVTLTGLASPGYELVGSYLEVYNADDSEAYETDLEYIYADSSNNTHFDEVMVWYHADQRYRQGFLSSMDYPYVGYESSNPQTVEAIVHYGTAWNHSVVQFPRMMYFGDGDGQIKRYTARESNIVMHEYQHLVTYDVTYDGLVGNNDEEDAMGEAFSDFFGASLDNSHEIGAWIIPGSGILRDLDNIYVRDDFDPVYGPLETYHQASQIFSGALWDLREVIGSSETENLTWIGLCDNLNQSAPDFLDGRDAIIAADYSRNSGENVSEIRAAFAMHEIGTVTSAPTFTYCLYEEYYENYMIHLKWTRNDDEEEITRYQVYRKVEEGDWNHWGYVSQPASGELVEDWDGEKFWEDYYSYKVRAEAEGMWGPWSNTVICYIGDPGDPLEEQLNIIGLPSDLSLDQNYPNPFNPTTTVRFGLPQSSRARLRIMNTRGQTVRTLVDEDKPAGWYTVTWDGKNESGQQVASGIYLYILETDEGSLLKKMTLIR